MAAAPAPPAAPPAVRPAVPPPPAAPSAVPPGVAPVLPEVQQKKNTSNLSSNSQRALTTLEKKMEDGPAWTEKREAIAEMIVGKYVHKTEEEEHDQSSTEGSERDFDNLDEEARSPNIQSPPFDSKKLEIMERELSVPRRRHAGPVTAFFFLIHCVVCVKLCCTMHIIILQNGGFYFFIPLTVCLFLIAAPLAFLELSLGQFTSQLPIKIFARLSPIATGVGFAMMLLRFATLITLRTEHRFPALLIEAIAMLIFDRRSTICKKYNAYGCHVEKACHPDEIFYAGSCYDRIKMLQNDNLTIMDDMFLTGREMMQQVDYNKMFMQPFPGVERVIGSSLPFNHYIDAILFFFIVCFLCTKKGIVSFSKASIVIVSFYALMICLLIIQLISSEDYRYQWTLLVDVIDSDSSSLFKFSVWNKALLTALTALSVGDGTLHSIGSMNPFNNNLYRDIGLLTIVVLITLFGGTFVFGVVSILGIQMRHREMETGDMTNEQLKDALLSYYQSESFVSSFYYYGWISEPSLALIVFFYFAATAMMIGAHVLAAENILSTMFHFRPSLLRLNPQIIRHCIFTIYFMLIAVMYFFASRVMNIEISFNMVQIAIVTLCAVQCIILASLYTTKRFLVNLYTMFSSNAALFKLSHYLSKYFNFSWTFLIPTFCLSIQLLGLIFSSRAVDQDINHYFLIFIASLPLSMGARELALKWSRGGSLTALTRPIPSWGPQAIKDKRDANYDEKAARILV